MRLACDSPAIRLSIVFLNYNRLQETRLTVEKLRSVTAHRADVEIIAVDNGSTDGTGKYLEQQRGIISILLDENTGISGYNHGFRKAVGEIILVLDDDSCPRDSATLDRLLETFAANPEIGIVACHIENPDTTPQWSWHLPKKAVFGPSPFFVGCGFGIRRSLFARIGWYPENFFLYQNEIDVAFRIRKCHYQIFYHPECRIVHRGQPSTRPGWRRIYYPTRNTIWLIQRYYPQPQAAYMLFSRLVIGFLRALMFHEMHTYWRAVHEAGQQPVEKDIASVAIRKASRPFWRQNSLVHQLLKKV